MTRVNTELWQTFQLQEHLMSAVNVNTKLVGVPSLYVCPPPFRFLSAREVISRNFLGEKNKKKKPENRQSRRANMQSDSWAQKSSHCSTGSVAAAPPAPCHISYDSRHTHSPSLPGYRLYVFVVWAMPSVCLWDHFNCRQGSPTPEEKPTIHGVVSYVT